MNSSIAAETRDQQRRKLKDMINRDDIFDVWVRWVLVHAPSVYVFINITLLIWIAQTIFNSQLNSIPASIFLIAPFFTQGPLSSITTLNASAQCPQNQTLLSLRSIPTISGTTITRKQLSFWGEPGTRFCVGRLALQERAGSEGCEKGFIKCSGYCVRTVGQCPITHIKVCSEIERLNSGYNKIGNVNNKSYCFTREENTPIVTLMSPFRTRCANDEHSNGVYESEEKYWTEVSDCKKEGSINSFYHIIDTMETNSFLANNNIPLTTTAPNLREIELGSVAQFALSVDSKDGCGDAAFKSSTIKSFLQKGPISPQFTQSLLIISFILLVAEIVWLIAYYCFNGFIQEKNIFVGLMSIIELVIIWFIYSQNQELFYVERLSHTLAKCLKQSVPAITQWNFGISSPQVFKMVIYINIVFLGLFITVTFLDTCCFKDLKRRPGNRLNNQ